MTMIRSLFVAFALLCSASVFASKSADYQFHQDRMMMTSYNIMLLSSFDTEDHITAYSEYGTRLWDVTFYPKVLSWKLKDGLLYVFSKSRNINSTYITCIDPITGIILWERP